MSLEWRPSGVMDPQSLEGTAVAAPSPTGCLCGGTADTGAGPFFVTGLLRFVRCSAASLTPGYWMPVVPLPKRDNQKYVYRDRTTPGGEPLLWAESCVFKKYLTLQERSVSRRKVEQEEMFSRTLSFIEHFL